MQFVSFAFGFRCQISGKNKDKRFDLRQIKNLSNLPLQFVLFNHGLLNTNLGPGPINRNWVGGRASKYNFGPRTGKNKLGARVVKYKQTGGQAKGWG